MTYDRDDDREQRMSKIRPKIPHDWEDLDGLDTKSLQTKIVECQTNLVENNREMKADKKLANMKDKLAELNAPYKDAKDRLTRMMEYCTLRLEERGK